MLHSGGSIRSSVAGCTADLVGRSRRWASIRRLIPKVARNRLSVLVLGESCRREEPVARAIHAANLRGQFVLLGGGPPARAGNLTCGREIPNRREDGKIR